MTNEVKERSRKKQIKVPEGKTAQGQGKKDK